MSLTTRRAFTLVALAAPSASLRNPAVARTALCAVPSACRAAPLAVASSEMPSAVSTPRFLSEEEARTIADMVGTPAYVYDARVLTAQAKSALAFPNAYGLTVRFAMKACPNAAVLRLFRSLGICIDASSGPEVDRARAAGYAPSQISLSSQEMPDNVADMVAAGVEVNACSIAQLIRLGKTCGGARVGLRFNPGLGSGGTGKTNVGGPSSSFGIWHEHMRAVKEILAEYSLTCVRVHTHIGSGSDPAVWQRVASLTLALAAQFDTCDTVNLGGGYKVGRMPGEASTDLQEVGAPVRALFERFAKDYGRELRLEIEPGTYLVANAGALLSCVQDVATTKGPGAGDAGRDFVKLDCGMTDILRPSLYGAQHPISIVPRSTGSHGRKSEAFIVSGHCCESGDLLTCAPGEPETLLERAMLVPEVGDLCVIDGVGAYCASMSAKNYNSFPEAPEVMLDAGGQPHIVRKRQPVQQIWQNEQDWGDHFRMPAQ